MHDNHNHETIIVGAGQAGLATGYHLQERGRDFIILDASERIGDSWRNRWDSLRLFTPARYNSLPGMPFPASGYTFPTKDDMGDFLETYALKFGLPVWTDTRVDCLAKQGGQFVLTAGDRHFKADNVVIAMANWQKPWIPSFAKELDGSIVQMHSSEYQNLSQLQDGDVLIVGAGNSGVEIAIEVVQDHRTWLSGRDVGHIPFRIETLAARYVLVPLVLRFLFHRVMTIKTPIGRKMRAKIGASAMPLVRTKPRDILAAGIERVPRIVGVREGLPMSQDGRVFEVSNVIWSTGFRPGFSSWIDLPIFDEVGEPLHDLGVVGKEPGLYFVGLHFLYAASSAMVQGVGRDGERIVEHIVSRAR
jgi:putative flavoprotein involved in K+ transport